MVSCSIGLPIEDLSSHLLVVSPCMCDDHSRCLLAIMLGKAQGVGTYGERISRFVMDELFEK